MALSEETSSCGGAGDNYCSLAHQKHSNSKKNGEKAAKLEKS